MSVDQKHRFPEPIRKLVENVAQLVSPPAVYYRLEGMIHDPARSLDDMAAVIRTDPDLTARLLRIANSAFYGFPSKIESVTRALATIGTHQLRDLVLATSVVRLFTQLPFEHFNMQTFWRHCLHVGVLARALAGALGEPNRERFYLIGLLHDVGTLVMYLKIPQGVLDTRRVIEQSGVPRYAAEQATLGFDHAETGAALLQLWRLPEALWVPVGRHHQPGEDPLYRTEALIVCLADSLLDPEDSSIDDLGSALQALGLTDEQYQSAVLQAEGQLDEILQIFDI